MSVKMSLTNGLEEHEKKRHTVQDELTLLVSCITSFAMDIFVFCWLFRKVRLPLLSNKWSIHSWLLQ